MLVGRSVCLSVGRSSKNYKRIYKTLSYWSDFVAITVAVAVEGMAIPQEDRLPTRGWTSPQVIALSPLRGWPSNEGIDFPRRDGPPIRSLRWKSLEGLNEGTVPTFKMHNVGTVPTFRMHNIGTVPTYKTHDIGTGLSYFTLGTTIKLNFIKLT